MIWHSGIERGRCCCRISGRIIKTMGVRLALCVIIIGDNLSVDTSVIPADCDPTAQRYANTIIRRRMYLQFQYLTWPLKAGGDGPVAATTVISPPQLRRQTLEQII